METRFQPTGPSRPGDDIRPILSICESYLRRGDYASCRDKAVKAQIINPNHPGPVQILAMCTVLAASTSTPRPDWYSILHLPKFAQDETAIEKNFHVLSDLLNPTKNPYPMAAKAYKSVIKAWAILSEPSVKALVDRELRMDEKGERNGETFWTRCPKCCYFYEYDKAYKQCLLRCQNVKCRGAFKAEALPDSAAPPAEVVNKNVYVCYGFASDGHRRELSTGRERWMWWSSPYLSACCRDKANAIGEDGLKNEKGDGFVDISDFGKQDKDRGKREVEDMGCSGVVNRKEAEVDSDQKENNSGAKVVTKRRNNREEAEVYSDEKENNSGAKVVTKRRNSAEEAEVDSDEKENNSGAKVLTKRRNSTEEGDVVSDGKENNGVEEAVKKKKMMARTIKKVTGRGTRVNMSKMFSEASDNEADLERKSGEDLMDFGCDGIIMGERLSVAGGFTFLKEDDDL